MDQPTGSQPHSGFWRIACCEPCELRTASGDARDGTVWNVSTLGVYVVIPLPFPDVGESLSISFTLPGDPESIHASARVVWLNPASVFRGCGTRAPRFPPGFGLEFIEVGSSDLAKIQSRVDSLHRGPH